MNTDPEMREDDNADSPSASSTSVINFRKQITQLNSDPNHSPTLLRLAKAINPTANANTAVDDICNAFAEPLTQIYTLHGYDYANQYSDLFSAATRLIDEDFLTPVRNIEVFASDALKQSAGGIAQADGTVPVFDISLAAFSIGLVLPGLVMEYKRKKNATDLLNWRIVQEKMDTNARERWFKNLHAEKSIQAAQEVSNKNSNQKEEDIKKQVRAGQFINFLFQYLALAQANAMLFDDKYQIIMDVEDLSLHFEVNKNTLKNDAATEDSASSAASIDTDSDASNETNLAASAPPLSETPKWLEELEQSKVWKTILTLTRGFAIYAMAYWLISYPLELAQKFGTLHFADPFLLPVLCFGIPVVFALGYLGFKFISRSDDAQPETQRAHRIALDYSNFKNKLNEAKQQFFQVEDDTPEKANKNDVENFAKLSQIVYENINEINIKAPESIQDNVVNYDTDESVLTRTEQVKKFFEKIKGNGAFTSKSSSARRGAAISAVAGIVLSLTFAWIMLDTFSVATKLAKFGSSPSLFAAAPSTFNPFTVFPEASTTIAAILIVVAIVAIAYSTISGYFEKKEKFNLNQKKLNEFNAEHEFNDANDLADTFVALAKQTAQKELLLKNLKEQLLQLQSNLANKENNQISDEFLEDLIRKASPVELPKFDGRYGAVLGFKLHSDNYFLQQKDDTNSLGDNFKVGFGKFLRRGLGFVEGMGSGSLMVRTTLFVFTALLPTIIPYNILDNPVNLLIVGLVALAAGLVVGGIKAYRDHANAQQERQDRFIDELPLRYQYLLEENKFLDTQIKYVNDGLQKISKQLAEPSLSLSNPEDADDNEEEKLGTFNFHLLDKKPQQKHDASLLLPADTIAQEPKSKVDLIPN